MSYLHLMMIVIYFTIIIPNTWYVIAYDSCMTNVTKSLAREASFLEIKFILQSEKIDYNEARGAV